MDIYLPIAEASLNLFAILGLGGGIGVLSGMFGVGGGFLLTPLLMFIGIPPAIAVATSANQVVGASVSGCLSHWKRNNVDIKMGLVLLGGGLVGSSLGVWIYGLLDQIGQIDLVISLCYVIFLGIIGSLMFSESLRTILRTRKRLTRDSPRGQKHHHWMHGLPFKVRFRKSHLYISVFVPISVGVFVGILSAIMGVGGGFVIIPAMIYLIGMPTSVVVGTSLFQIIFVSANITVLQASLHQTVDAVLAILLLVGGVVGAQLGVRLGTKIRAEELRLLLALLVLMMGLKVGYGLITEPTDLFTIFLQRG